MYYGRLVLIMNIRNIDKRYKILGIMVVLVLTGAIGFAVFKYISSDQYKQKVSEAQKNGIVARVSKIMVLPEGEDPTVAIVDDVTKLKNQPFFTRAINGDEVIIYPLSKKAILFRPKDNKIVDFAIINLTSTPNLAATPTVVESLKVSIMNGSATADLGNVVGDELIKQMPELNIVARGNAKQKNYKNSVVVSISGNATTKAEMIARILGTKVGTMPSGEQSPTGVDIVVIVGKDLTQ